MEDLISIREATAIRLLKLMGEAGYVTSYLALKSGLSVSCINKILSGNQVDATEEQIKKLCDVFGLTIESFYASDIFNNVHT